MNSARPHSSHHRAAGDYDSLPTRSSLLSRLRDVEDSTSWQDFFDAYWRLIYNVARQTGLSDNDAQDVIQETVIAVARRMPEFRYDPAKGSFKNWLLLITRRRIHDHFRKFYRSVPLADGAASQIENAPATTPLPGAQIDDAWEEQWQKTIFQAACARVRQRASPKQYQVFDYSVLLNVPAPEIGAMLHMSAAQVYLAKHRMSAAVKRAAAEIEAELNEGDGGRSDPRQ